MNTLFRKTFISFLSMAGIVSVAFWASLILINIFIYKDSVENYFNTYSIVGGIYTILIPVMLVALLPWLMLSFFGEWLYTRSLDRKNLFKIFFKEYLIWWGGISVILISLTFLSGMTLDFIFFFITLNLYFALILAGNYKVLYPIILYGIPVFLFSAMFDSWKIGTFDAGHILSWIFWLGYILVTYLKTRNYNDDLDLSVAGKADDENKALSKIWFISKELGVSNPEIAKTKTPFAQFLSDFRILTVDTIKAYTHTLFIFLCIILYFAIQRVSKITFTEKDVNLLLDQNIYLIICILVLIQFIFTFLNPKYLLLNKEEFLLTRPISRGKIYLYNYFTQGLFLGLILSGSYILLNFLPVYGQFFSTVAGGLNWGAIILSCLWAYIAGEAGIIMLILLLVSDFSRGTSFFTSWILNLNTTGIIGLSIFLGAIFFRCWDYRCFIKKEIGAFRGFIPAIKELTRTYALPVIVLAGIICTTAYINPFTKVMTSITSYIYTAPILSAVYVNFEIKDNDYWFNKDFRTYDDYYAAVFSSIKSLQKNPYDNKAFLILAQTDLYSLPWYFKTKYYAKDYNYSGMIENNKWMKNDIERGKYWLSICGNLASMPDYIYLQGLVYASEDNYDMAIKSLKKAISIKKKKEYLDALAIIYEHVLMPSKAIEIYKQANKVTVASSYFKMTGDIYWNNREYSEALDYYAQAQDFPTNSYYECGTCKKIMELAKDEKLKRLGMFDLNKKFNNLTTDWALCKGYIDKVMLKTSAGIDRRLDRNFAKWYLDNKKYDTAAFYLNRAEKYGDLALLYIGTGDKLKASEAINNALHQQKNNHYFSINNSKYDYKAYLAQTILKPDIENAGKALIIAPDSDQILSELEKIFKNKSGELSKLVNIKTAYDDLYGNVDPILNKNRNVEKTRVMLKMFPDNKYKEIGEIISSLNYTDK